MTEIRVSGFIGKEPKRTSGGKMFYIFISQNSLIFTLKVCISYDSLYIWIYSQVSITIFKLIKNKMILIRCFNGFLSFSHLTKVPNARNKIDQDLVFHDDPARAQLHNI